MCASEARRTLDALAGENTEATLARPVSPAFLGSSFLEAPEKEGSRRPSSPSAGPISPRRLAVLPMMGRDEDKGRGMVGDEAGEDSFENLA